MKNRTIYRATEYQLRQCIREHGSDELKEACGYQVNEPDSGHVLDLATNITDQVDRYLCDQLGVFKYYPRPDDRCPPPIGAGLLDVIVWDARKLNVLIGFANLVFAEYDCDMHPVSNPIIWDAFDLSGDDDVDYNGSYLLILADVLELYQKHHKPTGCEF